MATKLGANLLIDPGAEAATPDPSSYEAVVAIPGWTTTSNMTVDIYGEHNGDLTTAEAPPQGGSNYFYGGPNNASSSASQTIALKGLSKAIAAGEITATISGYLGGYGPQNDNSQIEVSFLKANGKVISTQTVDGPTSFPQGSSLSFVTDTVAVPKGTAKITYTFVATREQGSDNDGLADNLSLVLNHTAAASASDADKVALTSAALDTAKMQFISSGVAPVAAVATPLFEALPDTRSTLTTGTTSGFSHSESSARANGGTDFVTAVHSGVFSAATEQAKSSHAIGMTSNWHGGLSS